MNANPGDVLVVASHHTDGPARIGVIQEVHGEAGAPPYVVRWEHEEETTLVFPGPDAHIERHDAAAH